MKHGDGKDDWWLWKTLRTRSCETIAKLQTFRLHKMERQRSNKESVARQLCSTIRNITDNITWYAVGYSDRISVVITAHGTNVHWKFVRVSLLLYGALYRLRTWLLEHRAGGSSNPGRCLYVRPRLPVFSLCKQRLYDDPTPCARVSAIYFFVINSASE